MTVDFFEANLLHLRMASMVSALVVGLCSGYLAATRFSVAEEVARKIMTLLMVSLNWVIAFLVIWPIRLSIELVWLPVAGVVLMLFSLVCSVVMFSHLKLDRQSRMTLILAGSLSNLGYTGGAFVCYVLFGSEGLALASIYPILWMPVAYLIFFPLVKLYELRSKGVDAGFKFAGLADVRMLVLPAVIIAIILNLAGVKSPEVIEKLYIVDILIFAASSMAFFAIGLRVKLARLKNYINLYFLVGAIKFVLTPVAAVAIIWLLGVSGRDLTGLMQKVIIVLSFTPCAVLMVMMSNVFELDAKLASSLWVVTAGVFVLVVVPVLFLTLT